MVIFGLMLKERGFFNLKKFSTKLMAFFFALFIASSSVFAVTAAVNEEQNGTQAPAFDLIDRMRGRDAVSSEPAEDENEKPAITISSDHLSVTKGRRIQLHAVVTGVDETPVITWTSSDEKVATVNEKGKVRGKSAGRAIITASCEVNGEKLSADYALNVVTSSNLIKDLLEKYQVLSYQYSYIDDYYYTNDKEAWQYNFGYGPLYDIAAPYILLEYDYVRVFFEYEGKDWMIQLWKGQYGLIFYGSEIGIYNKSHNEEPDNIFTFYECPSEEDWVKMEMTLYHQELDGSYTREFTRPYGDYWWCTGFKDGHLRIEEPADELRMVGRLTLKSEQMANLFVEGLLECGFKQVDSKDKVKDDSFYVEGADVYLQWQDINEAENTMPIKVGAGFIIATNIVSFILSILSFFSLIGLGALFFI